MRPVVVTGATGFIGRHLIETLSAHGFNVRAVTRKHCKHEFGPDIERHEIRDLLDTDWSTILPGADSILHTAAVAHRPEPGNDAERERVRAVNVDATGELTAAASAFGVRRMIVVSSIGVLGMQSGNEPFTEKSSPAPHDFYSWTKFESERIAFSTAAKGRVELCIIRPPLVFGPHAPGNFGRLVECVQRGIPLPLGSIHNRRSLVSVWNLCDLMVNCINNNGALGSPLLVADHEVISTTELLGRCARILGNRLPPLPFPTTLLRLAGAAIGRSEDVERLCASLVVDSRSSEARLNWSPPFSLDDGLYRTLRPR